MARTDNLTNFLTDVATAIREKKGSTESILASDFDTEIINLPMDSQELLKSYISCIDDTLGANCTKLPVSITSIADHAFRNRKNLALTTIPSNVKTIGQYAFYNCTALALTDLPNGITNIDINGFRDCKNISLTSLPTGLTSIADSSFRGCSKLAIYQLSSKITSVGSYGFYGCTSIKKLRMHSSEITINELAFGGCTNLERIMLPNVTNVPTLSNINAFNNTPIASGTGYIYVPDTLVTDFQNSTNWSNFSTQIKPISEIGG